MAELCRRYPVSRKTCSRPASAYASSDEGNLDRFGRANSSLAVE